jgi:hypothetical protein
MYNLIDVYYSKFGAKIKFPSSISHRVWFNIQGKTTFVDFIIYIDFAQYSNPPMYYIYTIVN